MPFTQIAHLQYSIRRSPTLLEDTAKGAGKVSGHGHQDSQHNGNGLYGGLSSRLRGAVRGPGHGRCGTQVPGQGDPRSQTHPRHQVLYCLVFEAA